MLLIKDHLIEGTLITVKASLGPLAYPGLRGASPTVGSEPAILHNTDETKT